MEEKLRLLKYQMQSDEQLAEKLMQQETPEEVQALLKENGVDMTIEEIKTVRKGLMKALECAAEGELSEDDLEDVTGGGNFTAIAILIGVMFSAGVVDQFIPEKRW